MAILEIFESISQLAIQCRAFSVGALDHDVFWLSLSFSLAGILKALLTWIVKYDEFLTGTQEFLCEKECDWTSKTLSRLPRYTDGDHDIVHVIDLEGNLLDESITSAEWEGFLKKFPNL